jgi:hypothetical protein
MLILVSGAEITGIIGIEGGMKTGLTDGITYS